MMIESFLTSRPVSLLPEAVFIGRPREALNIQTRKACVFLLLAAISLGTVTS